MSNPILTATLRAKDETAGTLKSIVKGFTSAFTGIAKVAIGVLMRDVVHAMTSIGKESLKLGSQIETLQTSFTAFRGDVDDSVLSLDTLRKSVDGTVSDVELLTAANQALALGLPVDQLNDLFAAARKVGAAMGRTTLQSVQDLTTGIGRQSRLILDNLGIIVDTEKAYEEYAKTVGKATSELDDNERKTAFTNAAIASLNEKATLLGDNISNLTTLNEKFNASMTNMKTEIGMFLIPIVTDLAETFTKEWLPSIQNIINMFRSGDFSSIINIMRNTFKTALENTISFIQSINWDDVWNWDEVWGSLYIYAVTIWSRVRRVLRDWGARFKDEILPKTAEEWQTVWSSLFDFAGNLWTKYFVPRLQEIIPVLRAWLPTNTEEWANAWIGLWTFGEELWSRLLTASGDLAVQFANFVRETDWGPLVKAFTDTVGKALYEALSWGINNVLSGARNLLGISAAGYEQMFTPSIPSSETAGGVARGVTTGIPSNRTVININIGGFIGLDEASTRKQLANILASSDIDELLRRGVRP